MELNISIIAKYHFGPFGAIIFKKFDDTMYYQVCGEMRTLMMVQR